MTESGEPSVHRIDSSDALCFVNEAWLAFATENGAPSLTRESVLGRSLWDFIAGPDVVHLFRVFVRQVRSDQRPVNVPFRCDAPNVRRDMELVVLPLSAGLIEFRSYITLSTAREAISILDAARPRAKWHVQICSWCKRVAVQEAWYDTESAVRRLGLFSGADIPRLVHTVCPDCAEDIGGLASQHGPNGAP